MFWRSSKHFVLALYFVGSLFTFLKQHGLLYFPVTRGCSLALLSALCEKSRSRVTHCLDFLPPWLKPPKKLKALLCHRLKNIQVSSALYMR